MFFKLKCYIVVTYDRKYACAYLYAYMCNITISFNDPAPGGTLKHQKRLVRKFNKLIIIHQLFHRQILIYIHMGAHTYTYNVNNIIRITYSLFGHWLLCYDNSVTIQSSSMKYLE